MDGAMSVWRERLGLLAAAVLLPAALLAAGMGKPVAAYDRAFLAGQLLVAAPSMADPRFEQAVILMVRHDRDGALGIVINRPLEERSVASLLESLGEKDTAALTRSVRIFAGGPVQPEMGFVIHTDDYHRPRTIELDGHLAVTSNRDILRDIGMSQGPAKSLIAFGYAGWRAGQLEGEIEHGAWVTAPADAKIVFDLDREKIWEEATRRRTQDL
jgi:putative transcriptional regulator